MPCSFTHDTGVFFKTLNFLFQLPKFIVRVFIATDMLRNSRDYNVDSTSFEKSEKSSRWPESKMAVVWLL